MGTLYYSATTGGFYNSDIHETLPEDALEITQKRYAEVFEGQANGLIIVPDADGLPINAEPPAPTREQVEVTRQQAYQKEADPLFFKSQRNKATKQEWLDKIDEIDARFPYPEPPKGKK